MGRAMCKGWDAHNHHITIVDPAIALADNQFDQVTETVKKQAYDIAVFAVKPQIIANILPDYAFLKGTGTVILSVMAGTPVATFASFFGVKTAIIRAMPNTPAMVAQGITVCYGNAYITPEHQRVANKLLSVMGQVAWVQDETLMHAVTALSGSGPAYVFYLIEAMAAAGTTAGLPKDLSQQLARQTIVGAAALAGQSEEDAATLRQWVTSPGGTTEAALEILMKDGAGLKELMTQVILAATARSKDLS